MSARSILAYAVAGVLVAETLLSLTVTPVLRQWNKMNVFPLPKLLLWNASASAPRGFYLLRRLAPLHSGELVVAMLPPQLAQYADMRGYLPSGVSLLKHIAALSGQTVCRFGAAVIVDNRTVAPAADRDHLGRPLPTWTGCRRLRDGDVFLLNFGVPASFDGRYFGALPATAITARAIPLWTESARPLQDAGMMLAGLSRTVEPTPMHQSPKRMPISTLSGSTPAAPASPCSAHCAVGSAVLLSSAASASAATGTTGRYDGFVRQAAQQFNIPEIWIRTVIHVESNGNAQAMSPEGAIGLMQLMPATWADLQQRYHLGPDAFDPGDNILAGTGYLRELYDRFGPGNFLAAYHAGPARVAAVLDGHAVLGPDTLDYLHRLTQLQPDAFGIAALRTAPEATDWRGSALFLSQTLDNFNAPSRQPVDEIFPLARQNAGLFVALRAKDQ